MNNKLIYDTICHCLVVIRMLERNYLDMVTAGELIKSHLKVIRPLIGIKLEEMIDLLFVPFINTLSPNKTIVPKLINDIDKELTEIEISVGESMATVNGHMSTGEMFVLDATGAYYLATYIRLVALLKKYDMDIKDFFDGTLQVPNAHVDEIKSILQKFNINLGDQRN